jgi:hypothetical protein
MATVATAEATLTSNLAIMPVCRSPDRRRYRLPSDLVAAIDASSVYAASQ